MDHPLPVGTAISYADLSPRINGVIVNNDPKSRAFQETLATWNVKFGPSDLALQTKPSEVDYIISIDGELELLPVQLDGIREPIPEPEHWANAIY